MTRKPETMTVRSAWGAFAIVPIEVLESDLSQSARLVFIALMSHVDHSKGESRVWPSYESVMKRSGISGRATISRSIDELEKNGWLTRERRFGGSTIYTLMRPVVSILNDSSSNSELSQNAPVVQNLNDSSSNSEPQSFKIETLIRTNESESTKTESIVPRAQSAASTEATQAPAVVVEQQTEKPRFVEPPGGWFGGDPIPAAASQPAEASSPIKQIRKARKALDEHESQRHRELFEGLTTICVLDPKLARGHIARTAKRLRDADPSATKSTLTEFLEWWKTSDWRGRRGSPPTLEQVTSSWQKFRSGYADIPQAHNPQPSAKMQATDVLSMLGNFHKEKNGKH